MCLRVESNTLPFPAVVSYNGPSPRSTFSADIFATTSNKKFISEKPTCQVFKPMCHIFFVFISVYFLVNIKNILFQIIPRNIILKYLGTNEFLTSKYLMLTSTWQVAPATFTFWAECPDVGKPLQGKATWSILLYRVKHGN